MKRLSLLLLLVVATFGLASCKKEESKEFAVDGQFTAYEAQVYDNAPQVTYVTVTIKDGKISGYNIDVRQGKRTAPAVEGGDYSFAWNEKTKKELGYDYGMKETSANIGVIEGGAEWFEQAAKVEAYLLKNGSTSLDTVKVGDAFVPKVDGLAGVTVKNAYTDIAKAAVKLAKDGKFQSIYCSGTDLYSASMTVDSKGKVSNLVLDTLQSTTDKVAGTFVWKDQTKQQLKEAYGMKDKGPGYVFTDGKWAVEGKSLLEWYEQANLITKYVMEKGWSTAIKSIDGRGLSVDGVALVDGYAGVTVKSDTYYLVLGSLFAKVAK